MSGAGPGILVIGAGEMGSRHALHWNECGGRIVAIYDPDRARAEALVARYGARALGRLATIADGIAALRVSLAVLGSVAGRCDVHPEQLGSVPVAAPAPNS